MIEVIKSTIMVKLYRFHTSLDEFSVWPIEMTLNPNSKLKIHPLKQRIKNDSKLTKEIFEKLGKLIGIGFSALYRKKPPISIS